MESVIKKRSFNSWFLWSVDSMEFNNKRQYEYISNKLPNSECVFLLKEY